MQLATEKQLNYLNKLGVNYNKENLTIKEASILIHKTLKENKKSNNNIQVNKNNNIENKNNSVESVFNEKDFTEFTELYHDTQYKYYDLKEFKKKFRYTLKIDNYFFTINYPEIKKDFCFGYGLNGVSTHEEIKDAYEMEAHARKDKDYFIKRNLESLENTITNLKAYLSYDNEHEKIILLRQRENTNIVFYTYATYYNNTYNTKYYDIEKLFCKELTKDEIKLLIKAYEEVKRDFESRLYTYLKKYGLSKLHTWTYLVD